MAHGGRQLQAVRRFAAVSLVFVFVFFLCSMSINRGQSIVVGVWVCLYIVLDVYYYYRSMGWDGLFSI